jgi:hypothetical protein
MDTETFETSDINLTAFCIVKSVKFIKIYEQFQNHFVFILSDPAKCSKLEQEYLNNGETQIRSFLSARDMLISLTKNRSRSNSNI